MIVVESKFDENVTNTMNKVAFKRSLLLFVFISAMFIALGIVNLLKDNFYGGIFCICFGVLYFPFIILFTKIVQKKINKTSTILSQETTERYEFNDEFIVVKQQMGEEYIAEIKAKYSYLFKVLETNTDFILYISKVQAHVVPKDKIVEGSVEELKEIFNKKIYDRFKKLK